MDKPMYMLIYDTLINSNLANDDDGLSFEINHGIDENGKYNNALTLVFKLNGGA